MPTPKKIKTGGRTKGTPNKLTARMRDSLASVLNDEIERIPEYLAALDSPKDKLEAITRLMPFVYPRKAPEPATPAAQVKIQFIQDMNTVEPEPVAVQDDSAPPLRLIQGNTDTPESRRK